MPIRHPHPVTGSAANSMTERPESVVPVWFVTDPLCSWCYATVPELQEALRRLGAGYELRIVLAGLQMGDRGVLGERHLRLLAHVWRQVTETTGQAFCGRLPDGFLYHSERLCRFLLAATDDEALRLELLHSLHEALYRHGQDIHDPQLLLQLARRHGLAPDDPASLMEAARWRELVRRHVAAARGLPSRALPSILVGPPCDGRSGGGEGGEDMLDGFDAADLAVGGYVTAAFLVPQIEAMAEAMV